MSSLLSCLQLKATPLLLEISLDAITLLSQALSISIFRLLPIELFLGLKALVLLLHTVLNFIFNSLFPCYGFLFHSSLHLVKLALKIFLLLHQLLVVAIIIKSRIVVKLILHVVAKQLEPFFVLESQLLLQEIFLVIKLSAHTSFLFFEHLCETLFDKISIVSEFFLPLRC